MTIRILSITVVFTTILISCACSSPESSTEAKDGGECRPKWVRHVIAEGHHIATVVAADFSGDGLSDVIVNAEAKTRLYVAPDWQEVVLSDGNLDVLIAGYKSKNVVWYENRLAG